MNTHPAKQTMNRLFSMIGLLCLMAVALTGCETVIDAKLDEGPSQLSVDAWITDQPGAQSVRLTQTTAYFNNGVATPATNATVVVMDEAQKLYFFTDPDNDGTYIWTPAKATDTLARIGRTYYLGIRFQGEEYYSQSKMNRVPSIDSLIFRKEKINPISTEEGYQAEFYANDPPNGTDYYRVRYFRNSQLQNRPQDLILAYDGAFSGSGNTDGLAFIRPIRQSINPEGLYVMNDTVRVELQSIPAEAYYFLQLLNEQITNGGLFATPPANVPTNIINAKTGGKEATGFFVTSAVRRRTAVVGAAAIRAK